MKIIILGLALFCFQGLLVAQSTISGKVVEKNGTPILGANVYLKGTYDGVSTNDDGTFNFKSNTKGVQILVISFIGFESYNLKANVNSFQNLKIVLREDVNTLDAVSINAGTFEAGDNAKVTALKPLDIVTTASALGDFVGALQTLPGTSSNSEDGRLFVRGGDASETQIFVDGIRVFTPYTPSAKNIPSRGRFSPFLFKGITFSTGGYSAEYGQALSSVLLLNTVDESLEEKTDISIMTLGAGIGNTQIWGKSSLSVNASYINLAPYQNVFPDANDWNKPVQAFGGETVFRHRFKKDGLLKVYGAYSFTDFDVTQQDINLIDGFRFGLNNNNLYVNTSYKGFLKNDWNLLTGISFSRDASDIVSQGMKILDREYGMHAKVRLRKHFSSRFKLNIGMEQFITNFKEDYTDGMNASSSFDFQEKQSAVFAETDVFFSKKLATKIGVRGEYSSLLNTYTFSPRVSMAYKTSSNGQMSFAYGNFYQNPDKNYLKFTSELDSESASHIIANYQYVKNKKTFRIEAYYKKYKNLIKYNTDFVIPSANYSNKGKGYAKGLDVFWRDNSTIKNMDYWLSYSYLDTERDYKNYTSSATPNFASNHNLSVVLKRWVADWKSQIGLSYNFASGRSFTNPNSTGFLQDKTKSYNSVSMNWAYLLSPQKILYFSVSNVIGTENIFGYQYKNSPNANGVFNRRAITPNADRFFFIGFFWTISDNKKENQLNNL